MYSINTQEVAFEIKINGQPLTVDFSKMDASWVTAHLKKAAQRFLNDKYSGEEAAIKFECIAADLHEMHSGRVMPKVERRAAQSKADPVMKLARDKATTFLTAQLTAKLGKDMSVWAKNEKLAKLFTFTEKGNAKFDLAAVDQWIKEYTAKRDFVQEAKDELAMATDGVDLDDLGL